MVQPTIRFADRDDLLGFVVFFYQIKSRKLLNWLKATELVGRSRFEASLSLCNAYPCSSYDLCSFQSYTTLPSAVAMSVENARVRSVPSGGSVSLPEEFDYLIRNESPLF